MEQGNSYEEARKQRLKDNKRRFEELGVSKMANNLIDGDKTKNKAPRQVKSRTTPVIPADLVRRSSRPRNQVVTYSEGEEGFKTSGEERFRTKTCKTSYITTGVATEAERLDALKRAMSFQRGLLSGSPSFVKSLSLSHVSGNFLVGIPLEFRHNHLSKEAKVSVVLEDGEGLVYETNYNGETGFLTTGWKLFSMDHKLDDGDALVIELIEPTRFKVHIFKVSNDVGETSYVATRVATKAERSDALKRAMSFQSGLLSGNPSFVKSISHSYVSKKFVLRIPSEFCRDHLSMEIKVSIVLEDEEGLVYETIYNGVTGFLITGWKLFSMDHKLDDGDALLMELIEPTRLKVYLFKVSNDVGEVKVDQPKKARESNKYAKTVDAEQITKPTVRTSCNSKKAELCEKSSSHATTESNVELVNLRQELEIPIGDLNTAMKRITELEAQVAAHDEPRTANRALQAALKRIAELVAQLAAQDGALQAALKRIAELEAQVESLTTVNNPHEDLDADNLSN